MNGGLIQNKAQPKPYHKPYTYVDHEMEGVEGILRLLFGKQDLFLTPIWEAYRHKVTIGVWSFLLPK
jgi:hypothetical protein